MKTPAELKDFYNLHKDEFVCLRSPYIAYYNDISLEELIKLIKIAYDGGLGEI